MRKFLAWTASVLMILAVLLTSVDSICFYRGFYTYEYRKGAQAEKIGMSEEGLSEATDALLDYLRMKRDDIVVETEVRGVMREVYNERETMHMKDVRKLYQSAILARNIFAFISVLLLALLYYTGREGFFSLIATAWRNAILFILLFVAFIAVWCIVDFNGFWMQFHYVFFDNDLFLLDPNTSIMINMFPESFFFDIVVLIMAVFTAVTAAISLLTGFMSRRTA